MEEIEFSRWLFEGRPRQGKNVLPDGLNWLCNFAGGSEGHRENSISCIFLESPHQVDIKNVVKCYNTFLTFQCSKNPLFKATTRGKIAETSYKFHVYIVHSKTKNCRKHCSRKCGMFGKDMDF